MSGPDPKPPRREKDPDAAKRARLRGDQCVACERSDVPLNAHHVLYGADGRHDDDRNLILLCGSGTTGCHGKFHDADPETIRKVGEAIAARPDTLRSIIERLGVERGGGYLFRRYRVEIKPTLSDGGSSRHGSG